MRGLPMSVGALFVLLSGCLGPATVENDPWVSSSNQDPAADFSAYQTYDYMRPLGTDGPEAARSLLSTFLVNAVDSEMERKGLLLSDSPDLLVNFFLHTQERLASGSSSGPRRHRQARYGQWRGYEPLVLEYTEGILNVDVVDARRNVVVWEGLAQGPMQGGVHDVTQEIAHEVVKRIFERFPR